MNKDKQLLDQQNQLQALNHMYQKGNQTANFTIDSNPKEISPHIHEDSVHTELVRSFQKQSPDMYLQQFEEPLNQNKIQINKKFKNSNNYTTVRSQLQLHMKNQNLILDRYLDPSKSKKMMSQTSIKNNGVQTPVQYQMAIKVQKNALKMRRKSEVEKHKERMLKSKFGSTTNSKKSGSQDKQKKKSRSITPIRVTSNTKQNQNLQQQVFNLDSFNTTPHGTLSGQGYIQNPFSPKQQDSIELSLEHPQSQTSYVNTTQGGEHPYHHTIQSLGGTGNTSQLQIGQKMERLANKYNVEVKTDNQNIFERVMSSKTDERQNTISRSQSKKSRKKSKKTIMSQSSSYLPRSRSGSRSKSNSVSRSIRTFIGLGGGGVAARQKKRNDRSTPQTTNTRPISSMGSIKLKMVKNSPSSMVTTSQSAGKKSNNKIADKFYRELTVRKYFCTWIEKYIKVLKEQKITIASSNHSRRQTNQYRQNSGYHTTNIQSKASLKIPKTGSNKNNTLSKSRRQTHIKKNLTSTNDQILFKDPSKSSMHISQGFLDGVVSPISNSAILLVGNYQQNNKISNEQRILSKTAASLSQNQYQTNMMIEDVISQSSISAKQKDLNLESMKNIVSIGQPQPENCFINPLTNDNDLRTRNISTITGKSEFKETAHLGQDKMLANQNTFEMEDQNLLQQRFDRGLSILKKIKNSNPRMTSSTIKRTSPSPISQKSKSKSKERERSTSAKRNRYNMYKPPPSAARTLSGISMERSINVSAKKSKTYSKKTLSRSISKEFSNNNSTITRTDVEKLLKQKHFLIWRQLIFDLKKSQKKTTRRDPKSQWATSWRNKKMKKKVLCHLLEHTLRQKRLNDLGYQIMTRNRMITISNKFLQWIENFNNHSIERKKLFYSSQHWFENTLRKFYIKWINQVKINQHHRHLVRQTVPMRCLLRMINSNVPKQMVEKTEIGQELYISTKFYKMRAINEPRMYDSIQQFKFNLMQSIFQKLKNNYHKMCRFKANVAIKIALDCLKAWKYYVNNKSENRKAVYYNRNQIRQRKMMEIMRSWSEYAKYSRHLVESGKQIKWKKFRGQKRQILHAIRDFGHQQNEKNLMRYRARKFLEDKALGECFGMLTAYMAHRRQKRDRQWQYRSIFIEKQKALVFENLRLTCKKLSHLRSLSKITSLTSSKAQKRLFFKEWFLSSLETQRSRLHYENFSRRQHFQLLREAILLSQISRFKKAKADNFRTQNLKYQFLIFLRDDKYDREFRKEQRIIATQKVKEMRLRNIFNSLVFYANRKIQARILQHELTLSHQSWLKANVVKALRQNVYQQIKIERFQARNDKVAKKIGLQWLRKCAVKQRQLREALIMTVMKRNRKKAELFLNEWRQKAIYEHNTNILIKHRINEFSVRRAIKKLYNNRFFMIRQRQIDFYTKNIANIALIKKVWGILYSRHTSKKIINIRKANSYRFKSLCAPAFLGLKKQSYLHKMSLEIKEITEHRAKRSILNWWMKAVLHKQVQKQTYSFTVKNLMRKVFLGLRIHQEESIRDKINEEKVKKHLVKKIFQTIKYQRELNIIYQEEKEQQNEEMRKYYARRILINWSKTSKKLTTLVRNYHFIKEKRLDRIEYEGFQLMKKAYHHLIKYKQASKKHQNILLRKVYRHLRKQAQFNIIPQKQLQKAQTHNDQKIMAEKKRIFNLFKQNRLTSQNLRKQDSKAIQHLALYIQQKVFQILQIRRENKQRLKSLFNEQKSISDSLLVNKCIREMIGTYIIEPKLDQIGHRAFLKKQIQIFRKKVYYIKGRNDGTNMHEFEVKALEYLGKNLLRKVFFSLKIHSQSQVLKYQEKQMILEYQRRKWFGVWRQNYLLKAQDNYFVPVQQKIAPVRKEIINPKPTKIGLPPKASAPFSPQSTANEFVRDESTVFGTNVINSQRVPPPRPVAKKEKSITQQVQMLSEKIQTRLAFSRDSRSRSRSPLGSNREGSQTPISYNNIVQIKDTSPIQNEESPKRSPAKSSQPRQRHLQQSSSPAKVDVNDIDFQVHENFATTGNIDHEQKSGQTRSFKNFLLQKLNRSPEDKSNQQLNSDSKQSSNPLVLSNQSMEEEELIPNDIYQI